jgi:hypothetical protein
MSRVAAAILFAALLGCSNDATSVRDAGVADAAPGPDATPGPDASEAQLLAAIGRACDDTHPCTSGTICGPCGIATGQCVIPCTASGTSGCPTGAYCSKAGSNRFWTGNYAAHFCVRTCGGDSDCQLPTGNAGLSCNSAYDDNEHSGPDICNVSNSIGSTHACP